VSVVVVVVVVVCCVCCCVCENAGTLSATPSAAVSMIAIIVRFMHAYVPSSHAGYSRSKSQRLIAIATS
jgi:hypothetical protein